MKLLYFLVTLCWLSALSAVCYSQTTRTTSSPDKRIRLTVSVNATGELAYALTFQGQPVVQPSALGFTLSKPALALNRFRLVSVDSSRTDETWKPVWGEVAQIRNQYNELALRLASQTSPAVQVVVRFRVFNDGLGFRYEFPQQPDFQHFVVADEHTEFRMAADHQTFWIPGDYDTNEYLYNTTKLSEIDAVAAAAKEKDIALQAIIGPDAVQTPLLMKTASGLYISLFEAAVLNYPVMHVRLDKARLAFRAQLVPDAVGNKAYLQTPTQTPWRTVIVSDKATDLLASKLILNLNEPSRIADPSWIKPQKFVGMWWEMHVGKANWPLAGGKHGANTANVKKYIDFAAQYGFDGVLVEGWNVGWEDWFGNWKEDVFDFVTPYPDYDIDALTAYARQRGIRLIMHHETSGSVTNYERRMDAAFGYMRSKEINTVKTGYVGRIIPRGEHHDGQWMNNHYQRVAEKAAQYKIMVDSHESSRPTGLHRTYPNWLASEAARGSEFNNAPTLGITPEHTTILPFTRMLGGPMDFTPGLFHMRLNQFESTRTTRVRTTLAKQLALFVTLYSPLQMAADLPENYLKYLDAFQFVRDVPVDWDDTRILAAEPGEYVMTARKGKGSSDWFLGAITDENSRSLPLPLDFLEAGATYEATFYRDADNADWDTNPEAYTIDKQRVTRASKLTLRLAKGGGCAIRFRKL
ncbi:glycoside hydrolase family 97 protein [Rudanella paleaurantiibacter]|uniref:Glycoside hydrolase family 97 protein n=1 Tax=Rudanella paleaurantiibacter TaxID=2614655 RepID=A0A7J5U4S6_9BACT|nr:glycoside hydrolase family 97 protein [Rudanella paleaurantiibacter]KAB7732693.1 glycoside hydrolase family 97 protein [Rudanella paleaurantiibacter]